MESPLDRNPTLLINGNSHYYVTAAADSDNALSGGNNVDFTAHHFEEAARGDDRQQQQRFSIQQPIIVENDGIARHKDFSLFSSSLPPAAASAPTSDFLKIDSGSKTIVPSRDDKSSNTRNQDLKKISDESFLNAYEKEKSSSSRVSENVLTPMHVGIVLMNDGELANSAPAENPTPVVPIDDNHLTGSSADDAHADEFIPKVGGVHSVKTENDFVPSVLLSQKLIQAPLGRPLSFADTVQITNPPKRTVKAQSPMAFLFNDLSQIGNLFNFDDIINLLTGRNSQPLSQQPQQPLQQPQVQQTQQYQQYQSNGIGYTANYNKLASSSSNINAVKKPFYTKYLYPSTAASVRHTRMPKYATIPASEYQKFGFSGKWSDQACLESNLYVDFWSD